MDSGILLSWLNNRCDIPEIDQEDQEKDTMIANSFRLSELMEIVSRRGLYDRDKFDEVICAIAMCSDDVTLSEEGIDRVAYDRFVAENKAAFIETDKRVSLPADFASHHEL